MKYTFLALFCFAQALVWADVNPDSLYQALIPKLSETGNLTLSLEKESQRDSAAALFLEDLLQLTQVEEALTFDLTPIRNLSVVTSRNEKLRVLTYMIPRAGGIYSHIGLLLYLDEDGLYHAIQLVDNSMNSDFKPLRPSQWHGGLYYELIEEKLDRKPVYFVLGYRATHPFIHEKFIDVIDISNQRVQFGLPVFHFDKFNDRVYPQAPYRIRMQFSAKVSAVLRWNEDYEGIVMDHVVPQDVSHKGLYMDYGPDFTYDGLRWEDEKWELESQIQFENNTQTAPAGQNVPTGLSPENRR